MQALSNQRTTLTTIASVAMFSRGLEPEFPDAVQKQLSRISAAASDSDPGIRDLTGLPWCSIDNDDSRDLDQLTAIEPLAKGEVRVFVAVADVDALVRRGGSVDTHAAANTTSVYTAAGVFPMLPPLLSNDRTSLHEGEERLAVVVDMKVDREGSVTDAQLYRAAVNAAGNGDRLVQRAIRAFEKAQGLRQLGELNPEIVKAILAAASEMNAKEAAE